MIFEYDPHRGGFLIKFPDTEYISKEVTEHPLLNGLGHVLMYGDRIFGVRSYWSYGGLPLTHLSMLEGHPYWGVSGTTALVNPITTIDTVRVEVTDERVRLSFTKNSGPDAVEPLDHPASGLRLWLTRKQVMSIRALPGRSQCEEGNGRAMVPQVAGIDVPRARLSKNADLTSIKITKVDIKG